MTSCAFGGAELDELYITTKRAFWPEAKRAELPLGGALLRVPRTALAAFGPGIRGAPVNRFRM